MAHRSQALDNKPYAMVNQSEKLLLPHLSSLLPALLPDHIHLSSRNLSISLNFIGHDSKILSCRRLLKRIISATSQDLDVCMSDLLVKVYTTSYTLFSRMLHPSLPPSLPLSLSLSLSRLSPFQGEITTTDASLRLCSSWSCHSYW